MKSRQNSKYKFASSFMEYSLVIGIASLVFVTMNVYLKRGIQGRLKEMSDYFISQEQLVEVDPVNSTSNTTSITDTTNLGFTGGGTMLALLDTSDTTSTSTVEDGTSADSVRYTSAEAGYVKVPERPSDSEYTTDNPEDPVDPDWEKETNIDVLSGQRDRLRAKAAKLEEEAAMIESKGREMMSRASRMSCHGKGSCRRARRQLYLAGQDLVNQARDLRREANRLRTEANSIQRRIDELSRG